MHCGVTMHSSIMPWAILINRILSAAAECCWPKNAAKNLIFRNFSTLRNFVYIWKYIRYVSYHVLCFTKLSGTLFLILPVHNSLSYQKQLNFHFGNFNFQVSIFWQKVLAKLLWPRLRRKSHTERGFFLDALSKPNPIFRFGQPPYYQ